MGETVRTEMDKNPGKLNKDAERKKRIPQIKNEETLLLVSQPFFFNIFEKN